MGSGKWNRLEWDWENVRIGNIVGIYMEAE